MMRVDGVPGEQAISFAHRGWPVIPLHYPLGENRCSCSNPQCTSTAKHPMTRNGLKNASRGDETIISWWREHPRANIGILTGEDSGLVVLDVDPRHDGEASLKALEAEFGPLPQTLKARTGGNGWHFYFRHPGRKIPNKANLRNGLDIRGDGGYIVAPPSIHASLQSYSWIDPHQEPAILPEWLLLLICAPKVKATQVSDRQDGTQATILEGGRNSSLLSIGGFLKSKGLDQSAIAKALEALNHQLCSPPLPESEVQQISTSIGRYSEPEWPEPSELPAEAVAPEMSEDMLPSALRSWCTDIADRMQVPLEFVAGPAIVAIASLVGRKAVIFPKHKDNWQVIPNLWGCLIAPPGSMKSPALSAVLKPIQNLAVKARQEYLEAIKRMEAEKNVAKAEIDALKDALKSAVKQGNQSTIAQKKDLLGSAVRAFEENYMVTERRYMMNDPTIEKMLAILQENPQGLLLYRDELSGWMETMYKTGREGDREFFLESWNGDSPYSMDRIGRGTVFVDGLCLSVLGSLQPRKFQAYVANMVNGGKSDDGLLQRLQILLYPDRKKSWKQVDRIPDAEAISKVTGIFNALAKLPLPVRKADIVSRLEVRFSSSAQSIVDQWRENLEYRLLSGTMSPILESHLSKYRSLMPTLAFVFEIVEALGNWDAFPSEIGVESATLGISWCEFLEKHARKAYGEFLEPEMVAARKLLKKIKNGSAKDYDRCREIYRHGWTGLTTSEQLENALITLQKFGWIRTEILAPVTGRRFEVMRLHPSLRTSA